jgi:competence protein ComEA
VLARYRHFSYLILLLALVAAVVYGLIHRPPPLVLTVAPPQPTPLPTAVPTPAPIRCHVVGAVSVPGVYTLPPGSRVQNAIQAAGGPTAGADLERLNLAAVIQDQTQVVVPWQVAARTPLAPSPSEGIGTGPVNINTADSETLQTLPGIGPVLAGRIVEYREEHGPFTIVGNLTAVKGIGEATLEKLRPFITLGP